MPLGDVDLFKQSLERASAEIGSRIRAVTVAVLVVARVGERVLVGGGRRGHEE